MLKRKKFWKRALYALGFFILLLLGTLVVMVQMAKMPDPEIKDKSALQLKRTVINDSFFTINNSWCRKSRSGLYELYVEGDPFEMGVINGKLTRELVVRQEHHFGEQINRLVTSAFTRNNLKYLIGWFNRDMDKYMPEEYTDEIFGVSQSASEKNQYLGSNYQRILNYHAAHDIGHAIQNLALVGCTSFGTWNDKSVDSTMIIGRNFDFYVGDKFAEEKIVAFFSPTRGHKFMTVTWGGFIGAVSGMNEEGLSVTINAAKSDIPLSSATPVSIVTREILQYAKNIEEAIAIAKKRKMFVSESFLVASAADNKAVVIEKTPHSLDVYDPNENYIVCANHFQSKGLLNSKENQEQINESASPYRYDRLMELLNANGKNTVQKTVNILRDRRGLENADIGNGNEKAINQLIAHHSIVFEPNKRMVWVSTSPWQLGSFIAYDLKKIFAMKGLQQDVEISEADLTIAADSFLLTPDFKLFENFRKLKARVADGGEINPDSLVASNPQFYFAYLLAGDYLFERKEFRKAIPYYESALGKVIATKQEEAYIKEQLKKARKK